MSLTVKSGPLTSRWVVIPKPVPDAAVRLFCFPYAGGGSRIYRSWPEMLPKSVEVCLVCLPGREARLSECPFKRLEALLDALVPVLGLYLDKRFAFFGHSMGALVAFELARKLKATYGIEPRHMFISGRSAPHLPEKETVYDLPEPEFLESVRRLNGTPAEVLEHVELLELIVPLLRADFEIVETYKYDPGPPLACPFTCLGGTEDTDVSTAALRAWRSHTLGGFSEVLYPGDHFFINKFQQQILQEITRQLH